MNERRPDPGFDHDIQPTRLTETVGSGGLYGADAISRATGGSPSADAEVLGEQLDGDFVLSENSLASNTDDHEGQAGLAEEADEQTDPLESLVVQALKAAVNGTDNQDNTNGLASRQGVRRISRGSSRGPRRRPMQPAKDSSLGVLVEEAMDAAAEVAAHEDTYAALRAKARGRAAGDESDGPTAAERYEMMRQKHAPVAAEVAESTPDDEVADEPEASTQDRSDESAGSDETPKNLSTAGRAQRVVNAVRRGRQAVARKTTLRAGLALQSGVEAFARRRAERQARLHSPDTRVEAKAARQRRRIAAVGASALAGVGLAYAYVKFGETPAPAEMLAHAPAESELSEPVSKPIKALANATQVAAEAAATVVEEAAPDFDSTQVFDGVLEQGEWVSDSYKELGAELGLEGQQLEQFTAKAGQLLEQNNPDFNFGGMEAGVEYTPDDFTQLSTEDIATALNEVGASDAAEVLLDSTAEPPVVEVVEIPEAIEPAAPAEPVAAEPVSVVEERPPDMTELAPDGVTSLVPEELPAVTADVGQHLADRIQEGAEASLALYTTQEQQLQQLRDKQLRRRAAERRRRQRQERWRHQSKQQAANQVRAAVNNGSFVQ